MAITLTVLAVTVCLFIASKIRSDLIALTALVVLMVTDTLTPEEALSGFSNAVVVMMIGLFVVGGAVIQTGLANLISSKIIQIAGNHPLRLYGLVMLTTAAIGAFISNTGTVALLLPIVIGLSASTGMDANRLLMPMAFASSMGGMLTLIGTPPNLVINHELAKYGYETLSFFSFTPVGLIVVLLGTLLLWPLSRRLSSNKSHAGEQRRPGKDLRSLVNEYQLDKHVYRLAVPKPGEITDQSLKSLHISEAYQVSILEIERREKRIRLFSKPVIHKLTGPETRIQKGDVLYVYGDAEQVKALADTYGLKLIPADSDKAAQSPTLSFQEHGIAEVVVLSNARLVNRPIRDTGLRERFSINILGIQRNNRYLLKNLRDKRIQAGDLLLVHGRWEDIARIDRELGGTVVIGQPLEEASKITLDYKAPLAAAILLGMVVSMTFNWLAPVTAVMLAAILSIATGCIRNVEAAYQTINWETVLLIGAMLPMSLALEKTGVSTLIADTLATGLGPWGPIYLLAGIYLATSTLTLFINNTATAVLFAPIAIQSAESLQASPYPFLFAVTLGASMCFASPFSTPPNALVMSAGRYTFMDYVKVGLPLQLFFAVAMTLLLPLIFPF